LSTRVSISLRLTLWFSCIFFAGWALFGISMWANLSNTLKNERHLTLSRRIDRLQDLILKDQTASPADLAEDFADFAHATGNGLMEIYRADGQLAYPSPSSAAAAFPWPHVRAEGDEYFSRAQSSGQSYWVMAKPFSSQGQRLILVAAAPEAGNLVVMANFLWGLFASVPIVLLASSAAGYWISRRALKPVDDITATARSISIGNISERIPVSTTGDELQRLSETCNAMLDRLESSVNQIKRFTADASHELRGPLAFTRTVAEIAIKNPRADPESRRAFQDIVDEVAGAAVLLEDMLTLARADSLPLNLPRTFVDIATVVREACESALPIALQQGLKLVFDCNCEKCMVLGDAVSLKRMIWILLDNAMKYSRAGGSIDVMVKKEGEQTCIVVQDDGIGICAADLPFVFDRFYRADPSRGLVQGSGLGLAIAKWIAEKHSAQISLTSEVDCGTSFKILFPLPQASLSPETKHEFIGKQTPMPAFNTRV
jgi:heavy metal sensor kinase